MKRKIAFWLLAFLLGIGVTAGALYWDGLLLWAMPKVVLSRAIEDAWADVRQRAQPILEYRALLDPEGKYTAQFQLEMANARLGAVGYDMTAELAPHQLHAQGTLSALDRDMDLRLYLDDQGAAVAVPELLNETYYGVTYETFRQDLVQIPLMNLLVSQVLLDQWDGKVQAIRQQMLQEYPTLEIPQIDPKLIQRLPLAVLAAPWEAEWRSLQLESQTIKCRVLTCTIPEHLAVQGGERLAALEGSQVSCYLRETELVYVTLTQKDGSRYSLSRIPEAAMAFRSADMTITQNNDIWTMECGNGDYYQFSLSEKELTARWEGERDLTMTLQKSEEGLELVSQDFAPLWKVLTGAAQVQPIRGRIFLKPGSAIHLPEYKNLNQWSLEDFLGLLENLGTLIGIEFAS